MDGRGWNSLVVLLTVEGVRARGARVDARSV